MSPLRFAIAHGDWAAEITPHGAELKRLRWKGADLLWNGDPAWWPRTAPLLFPVVGAVARGRIRVGDHDHAMPKHGFARDMPWTVVAHTATALTLRLADSETTRAAYPFAFQLDLTYALGEEGLRMEARLENPGSGPLPAAFGFHPAFRWPLDPRHPKEAHRVRFEAEEPAPLRRLEGDLLDPDPVPSPVEGATLALHDGLFAHDALIWTELHSRRLRYGVPGGRELLLAFDLPHLGIWTIPGAPFLCLEPWQGYADPLAFDGAFQDKPGLAILGPGEARPWSCLISGAEPSE